MKNKAKDCEFGQLHNSLVRDRMVYGITNDQVRGRLLREADLKNLLIFAMQVRSQPPKC